MKSEGSQLVAQLHPLERAVFPLLAQHTEFQALVKASKLKDVEVMRALQWLSNKKILVLQGKEVEAVRLDKHGKEYVEKGLPEKRFLTALHKKKTATVQEISELAGLDQEEISVCLGLLKRKAAINISKDEKGLTFTLTAQGENLVGKESLEGALLKKLAIPQAPEHLNQEEKHTLQELLKRRKLLKKSITKHWDIVLTDTGKKLVKIKISAVQTVDRLTPEHLKQGTWKGKTFRTYDVGVNVPRINGGRKHHYKSFLDGVREKFSALGFQEMEGPIVETDFWDMDALFMPQFHSARDIHEAYYIKQPQYGKLNPDLVEKVKKAHETGYNTGSKGWQYSFDTKRTHRNLLRTQGTALSARMLASKDLNIPGKYFGITKCFRYDVIDATHLPDFYQTEGIVVEEGLNMSHLKGLLKMFAEEFAKTDKIKIVPSYFPFTEPSCELFAKHPELGWIELGGAGIFRPELTKPLGIDVPVIAWGIGIGRIGMLNMGLKDIRDLYSHDLSKLRTIKM
jgi:phenylalanyl-tRNA synthetase alpha chain